MADKAAGSSTPEQLFDLRVQRDPTRPFVTFYDDETGERAELSAKSLANWVAKTHYLLLDELGLTVGDRAYVSLPVHWLALPVLLGCWTAGLEVVSETTDAQVAFGAAEALSEADLTGVDDVFAVSLLSMARSAEPPAGMADYAASVRPQPDAWAGVRPQASADDPALNGITRADVLAAAGQSADDLGLSPGGRLLWTAPWSSPSDWVTSLLAPLAVGASIVLVRNPDPAVTKRRADSERATVVV